MRTSAKLKQSLLVLILLFISLKLCCPKDEEMPLLAENHVSDDLTIRPNVRSNFLLVEKDITVGRYFQYIDSIVIKHDSLTPYKLFMTKK